MLDLQYAQGSTSRDGHGMSMPFKLAHLQLH